MIDMLKQFKDKHHNIYEFIMFNLLSNIATVTNFIVLNVCTNLIFKSLETQEFRFLIFDYSLENGGLRGFLSFLVSFFVAQTVNFVVQRKLVFNANNELGKAIPIYLLAVIVVYIICLYIPTLLLGPISEAIGFVWASNAVNAVNILVQVILMYPVMKFVIMKKESAAV